MIPKRAFFFWGGRHEMSWLRSLSLTTFKRLNPHWDVMLFDKVPLDGMHPVHRSDLFRYEELEKHGGVYFDTDIVFFRSFPESLLEHDVVISIDKTHRFCNIGCLMARAGTGFFAAVLDYAQTRYREMIDAKPWEGQLVGTTVFNRLFYDYIGLEERECDPQDVAKRLSDKFGIDLALLPPKFVTPFDSFHLYKLYNWTQFAPPDSSIGVHWYGGDRFNSRPYEKRIDESNYRDDDCYLSHAIRIALAYEPERLQ